MLWVKNQFYPQKDNFMHDSAIELIEINCLD